MVGQIALVAILALSVEHNGWVWFQGGDQIWMTTTGWVLGQRNLAPTELGYLWAAAQAPVTWATGPTYVQALPVLVVAQVLVLGPIALYCVYAHRAGDRRTAPRLLGGVPLGDRPVCRDPALRRSLPGALVRAVRPTSARAHSDGGLSVDGPRAGRRALRRPLAEAGPMPDALLAGVLIGAAAGLKPPNLLVAGGAVLAYVVARRWREGLACGVAIAPALVVLLLWKVRGLGTVPAFALEQARIAARVGPARARPEPRPLRRPRPRPLAHADGPAARVLLEPAARAVGTVRGTDRRHPRPAGRDRGAARRVARRHSSS